MSKKKNGKKISITKFEKLLYTFTLLLALSFPIVSLFSKSALSKVNYENEKVKKEIVVQTKENESLTMKINELASLEKIETIAKTLGLSYNNSNIKVVE
jgi:cell division protein FtsL